MMTAIAGILTVSPAIIAAVKNIIGLSEFWLLGASSPAVHTYTVNDVVLSTLVAEAYILLVWRSRQYNYLSNARTEPNSRIRFTDGPPYYCHSSQADSKTARSHRQP
jgi:hypothetical protein